MKVWGAEIRPPSLNRALAAWLLGAGIMGRAQRRLFEGAVAPGATVVEPEPALFAALDSNCRLIAADNVRRLQVAAGRERTHGILHCSRFNGGDNRLTPSLNGRSVPVDVVSLDDVLPDETVDLIKIDVQGYEVNVVHGMQGILDRSRAIKLGLERISGNRARCRRRDLDALQAALALFLSQPDRARAMGDRARDRITRDFALVDTARAYLAVYRELHAS